MALASDGHGRCKRRRRHVGIEIMQSPSMTPAGKTPTGAPEPHEQGHVHGSEPPIKALPRNEPDPAILDQIVQRIVAAAHPLRIP
jgi:hypothetical protein